MKEWLIVGFGGMLGSIGRFACLRAFAAIGPDWIPISTVIVNLIGCLGIGYLAQWSLNENISNTWYVVGLRVGVLGGLTTFSSFMLEVVRIWQADRNGYLILLVISHLGLGLAMLLLGSYLAGIRAPETP